jgi:hypothetical protein
VRDNRLLHCGVACVAVSWEVMMLGPCGTPLTCGCGRGGPIVTVPAKAGTPQRGNADRRVCRGPAGKAAERREQKTVAAKRELEQSPRKPIGPQPISAGPAPTPAIANTVRRGRCSKVVQAWPDVAGTVGWHRG